MNDALGLTASNEGNKNQTFLFYLWGGSMISQGPDAAKKCSHTTLVKVFPSQVPSTLACTVLCLEMGLIFTGTWHV